MILIAVIVGYILGITPFIVLKIINNKEVKIEENREAEFYKVQQEILDEWLNGPKKQENTINQQDIINEYLTGKETVKAIFTESLTPYSN